VIGHTVTSVTSDGVVTTLITELKKKVEGFGTKWCHTTYIPHVDLISYIWHFRVEGTVASIDYVDRYIR